MSESESPDQRYTPSEPLSPVAFIGGESELVELPLIQSPDIQDMVGVHLSDIQRIGMKLNDPTAIVYFHANHNLDTYHNLAIGPSQLSNPAQDNECLPFADSRIKVYPNERTVTVDGKEVHHTKTMFDIVELFARNPDILLEKGVIIDRVWDDRPVSINILTLYVQYVRNALGRPLGDDAIRTYRGIGYKAVSTLSSQTAQS